MRWFGMACLAAAIAAAGCRSREPNYEYQLKPGELALRKVTDPASIPDFTGACAKAAGLHEAIQNSLSYLSKPSSEKVFPCGPVTHDLAVASLKALDEVLGSGAPAKDMNLVIRGRFDVYTSVGCDGKGTVLFTCYYTPTFEGSAVATDRFKCPLYRPPADLLKLPDGSPSKPMPSRAEIEQAKPYAGRELVWLSDPFEAYVAHIQGSARIRMPDGKEITVGYAANNGHEYRSIRAEMVKEGKIGPRDGLPGMVRHFRAHPEEVAGYVGRNPRYVFFAEVADGRPRGCLNEPVTAMRTIATDKRILPAGCAVFFSTKLPQRIGSKVEDMPYAGFALDQDAGGAIRAPGRCDLYLGAGDEAGELAGRAQNEGRLYYLFLKPGM